MKKPIPPSFLSLSLLLYFSSFSQNYSKDVKMGAKAAIQVEHEMGIYRHDSLDKLVQSVGKKLAANLKKKPVGFEFQFHLVDTDVPNAFALPGGYIYVTRGLLPLIQTEDELAGIMGHEMIHVVNRHSVRQFHREIFPSVLKFPGNLINAITRTHLGNIINVPIDFITSPFIAKYSRKHERESDVQGVELAARAGYTPQELGNALTRLSKGLEVMTGEVEKRSYFADHPYTPKRVEDINKTSKKLTTSKSPHLFTSHEKFISMFNGLCVGSNPKHGAFMDTLFVHPELRFSWIVPKGWTTMNETDMVAASHKDGDGAVALCVSDEKKTAREQGLEMEKKVKKSGGLTLNFAGDTTLHGLSAYLLRVTSVKKGKTVILEMIWLTYNQVVYQLTGISVPEKRRVTARALRSFKAVSDSDISNLMVPELKVVASQANESVEAFSKRTDNRLIPELTIIYNDLDKSSQLPGNTPLKIVSLRPYQR